MSGYPDHSCWLPTTGATKYFFKQHSRNKDYKEIWVHKHQMNVNTHFCVHMKAYCSGIQSCFKNNYVH